MTREAERGLRHRLPYDTPPLPRGWRWLRPAAYVLISLLFLAVVAQFQLGTLKAERHMKAGRAVQSRANVKQKEAKQQRGAIGRWRQEARHFWRGQNIYLPSLPRGQEVPRPHDAHPAKHPNMPFVVLLLTPFSYMTAPWAAMVWNIIKLGCVAAMVLMAARIVTHHSQRMTDYAVLLGLLAAVDFLIGDFQHGNTNIFVATAVVAHLWAFRRGNDLLAGPLLALGICLKLTPALFILYWLYQREWRLLGTTLGALAVMIVFPAAFTGWSFYSETISTWWNTTIYPGLVSGSWYPFHINQSLPGMIGRYFTGGDSGNIFFDPDAHPVPIRFDWITLVDFGPQAALWIVRVLQAVIVLLSAWAIGWRRLPRDDGRRALHWGLIVSMMMLLNQRTWDHHAPPMIVAHFALVYAAFYANVGQQWRTRLGFALLGAVLLLFALSGDVLKWLAGESGSDRITAYGTAFWHFLMVWVLCLIASRKLSHLTNPYASLVVSPVSRGETASELTGALSEAVILSVLAKDLAPNSKTDPSRVRSG